MTLRRGGRSRWWGPTSELKEQGWTDHLCRSSLGMRGALASQARSRCTFSRLLVDEEAMFSNPKAVIPLLFLALFWNGLVGVFDSMILGQFYREFDARSRFEVVEAKIVRSGVSSSHSDEGSGYQVDLQYAYEFEGQEYLAERFAFTDWATSDHDFAQSVSKRFPVGAVVEAYVDPDVPSEAALDVSGGGFPAAILIFLTPFNCIGLLILGYLITTWRKGNARVSDASALRTRYVRVDTGDHVVIGKEPMESWAAFLGILTGTSFLATFATIIPFGFHAPLGIVFGVWGGCVALSAGLTYRMRKAAKAPKNFLHVDREQKTFSFPADVPGEPLDSIQSIVVDPTPTGVTINDVRQYKHCYEAETPNGLVKLFEVKAGRDEGDDVLDLLRAELLG